uniref:carbonic anhydrase 4-like n=1 Tax=Monopterus albus TaxID=43700 RepID=UPI0009B2FB13|nr:carbonic anhydrase 4-like [Monopterus albus]
MEMEVGTTLMQHFILRFHFLSFRDFDTKMHLSFLLLCLSLVTFVNCDAGQKWCYTGCENSTSQWHLLTHSYCGGTGQSPVNIETKNVVMNKQLDAFKYTNFDNKNIINYIINSGHTVTCVLKENMVEVSGGHLQYVYSTSQFHFHWGSASSHSEGSEHTVDSKRYPMEMHIVSKRKDFTEATHFPDALAVLGFFIEVMFNVIESHPSVTEAWTKLTNYLPAIQNISSQVNVTEKLSIDDLLGNVNRAAYYRYNGSLTTPLCNETVVWTVFKEPIKVDPNLMKMFPVQTKYQDVFRPTQPLNGRTIYASTSTSSAAGPIILLLLLACLCAFSCSFHLYSPSEVVFLSSGESTLMAPGISLDDLLVGVNRTKYYRYLGSLTTPMCNEAVVWTVFKDPIQVSKDLIDLFSTTVHFTNRSSPFMTNVYRDIQPAQPVTTQPDATQPVTTQPDATQPVTTQPSSSSSTFTSCYSVWLMALSLVLGRS